jgi:hypothetical protein
MRSRLPLPLQVPHFSVRPRRKPTIARRWDEGGKSWHNSQDWDGHDH